MTISLLLLLLLLTTLHPPSRSILGSLGTFKTMWLWKSEYNEDGPNVVYRHAL